MKKFFYLALVAIITLACDNSSNNMGDVDIPQADQSVLARSSKNVISLMGSDKAKAQKAFTDAGYKKVTAASDWYAPLLKVIKSHDAASDDWGDLELYVYNIDNKDDIANADTIDYLMKTKETCVIFTATYYEGKLINIAGDMYVGLNIENANDLFIYCSKNFHKDLGTYGVWAGEVRDAEASEESALSFPTVNDYSNYCATVLANEYLTVEETGVAILNIMSGAATGYHLHWSHPEPEPDPTSYYGFKPALVHGAFSFSYSYGGGY